MYYEQEDVLDYLLSICKKKHIKCFWPSSLDPHTPPTALPSKRRIVMNPNWHNQIAIPFQLAHEMAHILNGDDTNWIRYYQGTYRGESKLEYNTNKTAIRILLSYFGTDDIVYNPISFMNSFAIPSYLGSAVSEELGAYCCGVRDKIDFYSIY